MMGVSSAFTIRSPASKPAKSEQEPCNMHCRVEESGNNLRHTRHQNPFAILTSTSTTKKKRRKDRGAEFDAALQTLHRLEVKGVPAPSLATRWPEAN
jgi:hypothetical protein